MKGPVKEGINWNVNGKLFEITNTDIVIDTPVGKMNTIEITQGCKEDYQIKRYYAKGIGLVQIKHEFGDSTVQFIDYELDKYRELSDLDKLIE